MSKPWLKFYPADWRDIRLRQCSLAARGLWIDLMTYMHEAEPYGHLLFAGKVLSINELALQLARPAGEVKRAMAELEASGVFSKTDDGMIYSRRMVRDKAKAEQDRENGKGGGNPILLTGVNPPDKAHIPESRIQKEKILFNGNGGRKAGSKPPRHGATSTKHRTVYFLKGTSEWEAHAADYRKAHFAEPIPDEHGGKWFKTLGEAAQ